MFGETPSDTREPLSSAVALTQPKVDTERPESPLALCRRSAVSGPFVKRPGMNSRL